MIKVENLMMIINWKTSWEIHKRWYVKTLDGKRAFNSINTQHCDEKAAKY